MSPTFSIPQLRIIRFKSGRAIPMITSEKAISLMVLQISEVWIMSILTAIFQAIGQALTWILPVSESGHSAIFHNFSGRFTNACSQLTGVVHIGIAIGIIFAFYKLFISLFKNFFGTINDAVHKRLDLKNITSAREFMYMTVLSFAFFVIYLIPTGKYGNLFSVFHRASYNETLLGEGICFALTGALLITAFEVVNKTSLKLPPFVKAIILGIIAFLAVPTAGCSPVGAIVAVGILLGMSDKYSLRYAMVISVPVLTVTGIIEICTAVTPVSVVAAIIAVILSAGVSFFAVKLAINFIIKKKMVLPFAIYDIALGLICFVIGIVQTVAK